VISSEAPPLTVLLATILILLGVRSFLLMLYEFRIWFLASGLLVGIDLKALLKRVEYLLMVGFDAFIGFEG